MAKIRTLFNAGKGYKFGDVSVNSYNVCPTAKVAGTDSIKAEDLKKYDFFNVTSSAAASNIILNDDIPIGSEFILKIAANGCQVKGGTTGTINGGTTAQIVALAANSSLKVLKTSATTYVAHQYAAAGTVTAPTPGTDT